MPFRTAEVCLSSGLILLTCCIAKLPALFVLSVYFLPLVDTKYHIDVRKIVVAGAWDRFFHDVASQAPELLERMIEGWKKLFDISPQRKI